MLGYWNNPEATKAVISEDGWLNSGDIAQIDEQGRVTITGRLKDIIVTSTGEKFRLLIWKPPFFVTRYLNK